ncbi:hypothetical protein [Falsiroseomonas oryzae]|uniref:hypothetical protein n=1 Tax=Falsiroseomonas oryzae TaxID=2766473 RepID=UPI0022EA21AC|nr:hypothetical protein [Roseomonas sp. MO-31]
MDQNRDRRTPATPAARASQPSPEPAADPFGLWLQARLHQLYDGVTREPIPPELLRLIEEDRHRRGG